MKKLPRSFYLRPTTRVARELLGKHLVRIIRGQPLVGRIVETEAYCADDPASHSYNGRTRRNDVMFWEGGHLYVYFTYGMHFCANVVTRRAGMGEAVLIRAIEPVKGIEVMIRNRTRSRSRSFTTHQLSRPQLSPTLTNGPAKLSQALGIGRNENGTDLLSNEIYVLDAPPLRRADVGTSSRIGIVKGKEKKWRYFLRKSRWVSR